MHDGGNSVGSVIRINSNRKHHEQSDTLLHEVQHLIQEIEGFADGSGQQDARRQLDDAIKREEESPAGTQQKEAGKKSSGSSKGEGRRRELGLDEVVQPDRNKRNASEKRRAVLKKLQLKARLSHFDFAELIRKALGLPHRNVNDELYRRVAGEIDARTVDKHSRMWASYYDSRRFRGVYDGKERVEPDSSQFRYLRDAERVPPLGETGLENLLRGAIRRAFENVDGIVSEEKRLRAVYYSIDSVVPDARINDEAFERFVRSHPYVTDEDIDSIINKGIVVSNADAHSCWKLEDVLDAHELYAAYPELRDITIQYKDLGCWGILGEAGHRFINLNSRLQDDDRYTGTLLHEVQHIIQKIEGFARGSDPSYSRRQLDYAIRREEESLARAEKEKVDQGEDAPAINRRQGSPLGVDEAVRPNLNRRNASKKRLTVLKALQRRARLSRFNLANLIRKALGLPYDDIDYELYRRAAGEIEARVVSNRRYMNEAQRILRPFNDELASEYGKYGGIVTFPNEVEDFFEDCSVAGAKAADFTEAKRRGLTYTDPADGQEKFIIPIRDAEGKMLARLKSDFTRGQLLGVPSGGHRDVTMGALLPHADKPKPPGGGRTCNGTRTIPIHPKLREKPNSSRQSARESYSAICMHKWTSFRRQYAPNTEDSQYR